MDCKGSGCFEEVMSS
jgi:hypothetical protein